MQCTPPPPYAITAPGTPIASPVVQRGDAVEHGAVVGVTGHRHDHRVVGDVPVEVRHRHRSGPDPRVGESRELDDVEPRVPQHGDVRAQARDVRRAPGRPAVWAATRPGRTNAATLSTWPSVSWSSTSPYGSHTSSSTPSSVASVAAMSARVIVGLRFGCRRHCSVVIAVPCAVDGDRAALEHHAAPGGARCRGASASRAGERVVVGDRGGTSHPTS